VESGRSRKWDLSPIYAVSRLSAVEAINTFKAIFAVATVDTIDSIRRLVRLVFFRLAQSSIESRESLTTST
jgi:hypothetical protein